MTYGLILRAVLFLGALLLPPIAVGAPRAAAESVGIQGPVKLVLRLHETKIKVGEKPWFQIRLTNVGNEDLLVTDPVFADPWELYKQSGTRYFTYLEVVGPDGRRVEPTAPMVDRHPSEDPGVSGLLERDDPEVKAKVEEWKRAGLTESEIDKRVLELNIRRQDENAIRNLPRRPTLRPGESIETKSWFHHRTSDGAPAPARVGNFSRLEFFRFDKPGQYKIRAVYDFALDARRERSYREGSLSMYGRVLTRTPWVRITVKP